MSTLAETGETEHLLGIFPGRGPEQAGGPEERAWLSFP